MEHFGPVEDCEDIFDVNSGAVVALDQAIAKQCDPRTLFRLAKLYILLAWCTDFRTMFLRFRESRDESPANDFVAENWVLRRPIECCMSSNRDWNQVVTGAGENPG